MVIRCGLRLNCSKPGTPVVREENVVIGSVLSNRSWVRQLTLRWPATFKHRLAA
jgi:hypothetical protein